MPRRIGVGQWIANGMLPEQYVAEVPDGTPQRIPMFLISPATQASGRQGILHL